MVFKKYFITIGLFVLTTSLKVYSSDNKIVIPNNSINQEVKPKAEGLASFSIFFLGGGMRYSPFQHFAGDIELGLIPAESGGIVLNTTIFYSLKPVNSSFITGLTYANLILPFAESTNNNILASWAGYRFKFTTIKVSSLSLRIGALYSFEDAELAPYFYLGLGFPLW